MNELSTLFRSATDQAPHEHIDPQTLVRAGRARVRRRRGIAGVAAAAVGGLAVGVPLTLGSPATPPVAGQPGQVLTLADATPAQDGVDYDVLGTFTAHSTDSTIDGEFVRGVLNDGTIVVQSYPRGSDGASRITLVGDAGSRPVDAPRSLGNYLGATPTALVFGGKVNGVWMLDLTSLTWYQTLEGQDFDTNTPAQPLSATQNRPTEIHLARGAAALKDTRAIFEATLGERTASQLATGGDVAAFGGHVAWTATYDAPNDRVVVHDQATATNTSFDPHTGSCDQKSLGLTTDRVVVMVNCADAGDEQTETDVVDRIDVFDLTGKAIARITGDDFGPVRMTERYLTISSWKKSESGTYTYDLATGRFLKVEDSMSGLTGGETGTGSTLVWQKRLDGEHGATYVVAQMR
jgi:hypothetical protein